MTTPLPSRTVESTVEEHLSDHDVLHGHFNKVRDNPSIRHLAYPVVKDHLLEASFGGVNFPAVVPTGWRFLRNGVAKPPADTDWGAFGQEGWVYSGSYGANNYGKLTSYGTLYSNTLKTDGTYTYAVEFDLLSDQTSNLLIALGLGQMFEGNDQELRSFHVFLNDVEIVSERRTGLATATNPPSYTKGEGPTATLVQVAAGEPVVIPLTNTGVATQTVRLEIRNASTNPSPPAPSFFIERMVIFKPDVKPGDFLTYSKNGYEAGLHRLTKALLLEPGFPTDYKLFQRYSIYAYYSSGLPISNLTYRTPYVMKPNYARRTILDELGNQVQQDATLAEPGPIRTGIDYDVTTGETYIATGKYEVKVYSDFTGLVAGDVIELTVESFGWETTHYYHFNGQAAPSPQWVLPPGFANGDDFTFTFRVLNGTATGPSTADVDWFEFVIEEAP